MTSYDICFCANHECKFRPNCERRTERISKDYKWPVAMARFAPDENGECNYYWPKKESEVNHD